MATAKFRNFEEIDETLMVKSWGARIRYKNIQTKADRIFAELFSSAAVKSVQTPDKNRRAE